MSQQINLYHDRFRPVIDPIGATRLVGLVFASLAVLAATWSWSSWRLSESLAEASRMRGVLEARRTELADLTRSVGARRADPRLEEALARAEALHSARTELMALLDSGALGAVDGFSGQMRALARQSATGLWLTGFDLSPGRVELQGGALSAELVPAYLRRLSGEKAMEGISFNGLRIGAPVREAAAVPAAPDAAKGGKPVPMLPPHVEFVVASDARAAEALPRIADELKAQGYRFVLVSDYVGERRRPSGPLQRTAAIATRMLEQVTQRAAVASPFGAVH
jgi:hypothetical protein